MAAMVTMAEILAARRRISPLVHRTALTPSLSLSEKTGQAILLKNEQQQLTGSFKLRGATNAVLSLSDEERARGVTAASTGNHGRALSHAAKAAGTRAVICMSSLVPSNKVEAIKALGAEARIVGRSQDDAQIEVNRLVAEEGLVDIPPFDKAEVIAGQGTLGLEILEDVPELDARDAEGAVHPGLEVLDLAVLPRQLLALRAVLDDPLRDLRPVLEGHGDGPVV